MKIIAFTGAGISKSAGIPTFEEREGIKEKLSVEFKNSHPKEFQQIMENLRKTVEGKEPTKAHKALADLQIPVITMNVDGLHQKAGSRVVFEIHGSCRDNNVVLYGQDILHKIDVMNLIIQTARKAKSENEKAVFLVIGTSMQTAFANLLVWIAEDEGMEVHYINENADEEVPKFLKQYAFLPQE